VCIFIATDERLEHQSKETIETKRKQKGEETRTINIKQAWSTDEKGEGKGSRAVLTKENK